MHIAFNGWFWNRPDTGSGQYTRELLHALLKIAPDLRLTLILPEHSAASSAVPSAVQTLVAPPRLPGAAGKVWFEQVTFPLSAARAGADVAHVPYWASPLTSSVPIVTTIHDVIALALPVYRGGLLGRLYTSLVSASARGSSHILTDSQASRDEIAARLAVPPERISVATLAADRRFHPIMGAEQDPAVRQKYDLPERFALYLGGFDIRKNVHTLLLAWTYVAQALADDVPLVLAGRPPHRWGGERFPDLPAYAERLGLSPYIRWLGEVDEADKPALYRLAQVMVFPSRYEGFGLPPLEAMACGTPVVACSASSIPEIVGDAAFLVDPDDARDMAGAILGILLQPPLAAQLRNLGLSRASQFNWQKTAREALDVYAQVAGQPASGGTG